MKPNSRAQHATRTNQWTINRYPSVTGHLAIISLIYISITYSSISWLLFTYMSSCSCTVVFINSMTQMPKSCSAQKKRDLFFSSGIKHEEKEEKEEEIPQFRNCECILELICFIFIIKYKLKKKRHACSNKCHYW